MANWEGRTALIISGAPQEDLSYVMDFYERLEKPLIICADRGLEYALRLGMRPDLFVADCDSSHRTDAPCEFIRLVPEKDDTDTMHALNVAIDRGCTNVVIVCATGGRIDHMLANLALCEYCAERNVRCVVADRRNSVEFFGQKPVKIQKDPKYSFFSLIPLDHHLEGVTIQGAKYPLEDARVSRSNILTVSNEFLENEVEISVKKGKWLLVRSGD